MFNCIGCETDIHDETEYEISGEGPFCSECRTEHKCRSCWGRGDYAVCRNSAGELDYLRGQPTGQREQCGHCHGEGYRL